MSNPYGINYRLLPAYPLAAFLFFCAVFDLSIARFDLSAIFKTIEVDSLRARSCLIIVQLGCGLVLFASAFAGFVAVQHFRRVWPDRLRRQYYLLLAGVVAGFFVAYNTLFYELGYTNFPYFIFGIFSMHLRSALVEHWSISAGVFNLLFYLPFIALIVSAAVLSAASTSLALTIDISGAYHRVGAILRERRRMIAYSFFAAAALISAIIIFIFSWHNLMRSAISGDEEARQFTGFMFAFSIYWSLAYCTLIATSFAPLAVIYNSELERFLEHHRLKRDIAAKTSLEQLQLQWVGLSDFVYVVTLLSPLITSLITNTFSLFGSGE